ncbi:hypothetical protein PRIC1_014690 [Phytophthora ramorum]|uniref:uncharacterized protein n=1 Tax=Phytophthora ramorum TaxID=164328 RepID=UPI0030AA220E|nr:hypothetical protein KRP23_11892 [Phytophthora ramorum]KAH7496131.1 hypothetical protein KRP22_14025 [Phytophthora ramorum]
MLMKAPSAEEVLALVNAATGPDGNLDPAMHQLLLQLQEQHVLNQAQAQSGAHAGTGPTLNSGPSDSGLVSAAEVAGPEDVGPATTAMKRKSIPLSMKKEAIQWIMGPGRGVPSRAEKHFGALNWDVSASSFRKWWKNRDKILGDSASKKRISGGGRKPFLEDSEEKLLVVVIQERAKKDRVTRKWIAKTARHMFHRSDSTFKASENWVTKFIRRNGLTLKRSYVTSDPPAKLEQRRQQILASGAATEPGNNVVV